LGKKKLDGREDLEKGGQQERGALPLNYHDIKGEGLKT